MSSIIEEIKLNLRKRDSLQRLIIINVVVFAAIGITNVIFDFMKSSFEIYFYAEKYLAVPSSLVSLLTRPWTLITYAFLHEEIMHILFNMLWLFWMGKIFTEYLGQKKLTAVYFLGAMSGAVLYILFFNIFPLFEDAVASSRTLGASASVLAITIAAATLLPDYTIFLLLIGPVKLKYIAGITVLLDLLSMSGGNAGGHIAHLGGALFGFIYIKQLKKGNDIAAWFIRITDFIQNMFSAKPKMKVAYSKKRKASDAEFLANKKSNQEIIDQILDKISKSGYGSLTKEERELLFNASKNSTGEK
ncbi:MAG: rhomboid family intramembrane serine protease [Bacteroidia bacterium]